MPRRIRSGEGEAKTFPATAASSMLAVNGPKDQLTVLQKVVGLFSNAAAMKSIKDASTEQEMIDALKANLDA